MKAPDFAIMESSCPTCASIFIRPECAVKPDDSMNSTFFERDVEFTAHGLRASASLDCRLCLSVWEDFQAQYKRLQSPPWKIDEKTVIQISLGWSRPGFGKDCAAEEGGDGDQKNLSCSSLTYHLRSDDNEKAHLYVSVEVWPESGKSVDFIQWRQMLSADNARNSRRSICDKPGSNT
jgi:hypothetical protein